VELSELVEALSDPGVYPESPRAVQVAQTQMSVVFLTEKHVYKVKKPVNLGYLDYSSLELRHHYCQREVALNRRLCPETYLGVVAITRQGGRVSLDGSGEAVDYAVKMRRLPQESMMDVLLRKGRGTAEMVARVAERLARFHAAAETGPAINPFGELETIRANTSENFQQTAAYVGRTVSAEQYQRIRRYTENFIEASATLFRRRVSGGRIKDCHGDLHAAHICFTDGICIYDCIEFNDRFRYCDVASEVAFLAMDLDHYGEKELSRAFVDAYVEHSRDRGLLALLDFYKCYRAYVRGKVEGFKLDDPLIPEEERKETLAVAREYFRLAESYARGRREAAA
jgi:hypothetical protein